MSRVASSSGRSKSIRPCRAIDLAAPCAASCMTIGLLDADPGLPDSRRNGASAVFFGEFVMRRFLCAIAWVLVAICSVGSTVAAETTAREFPPGLQIPDAARPGPGFDAERATDAYVALLSPEQRA